MLQLLLRGSLINSRSTGSVLTQDLNALLLNA